MLTRQEEEDLLRLRQLKALCSAELQKELDAKIAKIEKEEDAYTREAEQL